MDGFHILSYGEADMDYDTITRLACRHHICRLYLAMDHLL